MAMTREEFEHARDEYDRLPGTPPFGYAFRSNKEVEGQEMKRVAAEMKAQLGGAFWRMTKTHTGVWLEAWADHPYKMAKFDPPSALPPAEGGK